MPVLSPAAVAMAAQWDAAAQGWDCQSGRIRDWLAPSTTMMLHMAGVGPGQNVLDIAAGAGDQSLDLAAQVGAAGRVTATDISPVILSLAAARAKAAGVPITTHLADAADLGLPDATFDAAICRLGLMFLPDPLAGLAEARRVLKPGARLACLVFGAPQDNPCLRILIATALEHAGQPPRDPFRPGGLMSLGRPGHLHGLFEQAGFANVTTTRIEAPFRLPRTADYLDFIRDGAGPILHILSPLSPEACARAWDAMSDALDAFQGEAGWVGPNGLLLTVGTR